MVIGTTAAILGGAALIGGSTAIAASAAKKGAKAQAGAAEQSAQLQAQQFQQTRTDLAPWRQVGEQALYQYADLLGVPRPSAGMGQQPGLQGGRLQNLGLVDLPSTIGGGSGQDGNALFKSPGYQFRLGEGIKAVERSAASRGSLQSGATMKAVQRFGEGLASQEYQNYASRLAGLAGIGQQATTQTGQLGAQAAFGQGQALQQAGQARASGFAGSGAAISGGLGQIGGLLGFASGGFGGSGAPASTPIPLPPIAGGGFI